MSSPIGRLPNQAPANAHLGDMSRQNSDSVNLIGGTINRVPVTRIGDDTITHSVKARWSPSAGYPNAQPLNSVTQSGIYISLNDSQSTSALNFPEQRAGELTVSASDGTGTADMVFQKYHTYGTNNVWVRYRYNGTWSGWTRTAQWSDRNANNGFAGLNASGVLDEAQIPSRLSQSSLDSRYITASRLTSTTDGDPLAIGQFGIGQSRSLLSQTSGFDFNRSYPAGTCAFIAISTAVNVPAIFGTQSHVYAFVPAVRDNSESSGASRGPMLVFSNAAGSSTASRMWVRLGPDAASYVWSEVMLSGKGGHGSNFDADKLDGMEPATSATANTIAQRGGSGELVVQRLFTTITGPTTGAAIGQAASWPTGLYHTEIPLPLVEGFPFATGALLTVQQSNTRGFQLAGGSDLAWRQIHTTQTDGMSPWYKVWHENNDGSGSGLDADLLDGAQADVAATANTIAQRNTSGDLNMRYGTTQYVSMSHGATARTTDNVFYSSTDNYVRKNTAAGFKTSLGLVNVASTGAYSDLTGAPETMSSSEATAGTATTARVVTAAVMRDAILALASPPATATQAVVEAGTSTTVFSYTPQRLRQAADAAIAAKGYGTNAMGDRTISTSVPSGPATAGAVWYQVQ